jgi:cyanophycinase
MIISLLSSLGRFAGFMLLCAALGLPAQAAETPKGSLVIVGGGLRVDNALVWRRIVAQAGGAGARIAVFPSASGNPEAAGAATVATLRGYGAEAWLVPVSIRLKDVDYHDAVKNVELVEKVAQGGGVFFTGGDQGRITKALLTPDGGHSALLDAVWDVYRKGGVIAGSSAGAAIMSTTMFDDALGVLNTLKLGVNDNKEIAPGLGFIGPDIFVDQHFLIRGRFARMLPVMLKKNYKLGIGVDENTAMVVTDGRDIEVIGYKGAVLIDLSQASTTPELAGFNLSNARISYFDQGDRYNFVTKVFTPSKDKEAGRVRPAAPYFSDARFYTDILGNTTVVDLMQHLIDSRQESTIGLAFGGPDSIMPSLGFEFKFSKVEESVGYFSSASGGEAYSVLNLRLDVRPIEMHLPLYHYR